MDKLNPARLISVRATLPIYLIDQVSSLQRRAERRNGKFKKNNEDQKYTSGPFTLDEKGGTDRIKNGTDLLNFLV